MDDRPRQPREHAILYCLQSALQSCAGDVIPGRRPRFLQYDRHCFSNFSHCQAQVPRRVGFFSFSSPPWSPRRISTDAAASSDVCGAFELAARVGAARVSVITTLTTSTSILRTATTSITRRHCSPVCPEVPGEESGAGRARAASSFAPRMAFFGNRHPREGDCRFSPKRCCESDAGE